MKITYYVAKGDPITIDVEEEWAELVIELDHKDHNNDRRTKRHKVSLEAYDEKGNRLESNSDVFKDFIKSENKRYLYEAISQLDEKHSVVILERFINGRTCDEIAEMLGISRPAVSQRTATAMKKLEKMLKGKIIF